MGKVALALALRLECLDSECPLDDNANCTTMYRVYSITADYCGKPRVYDLPGSKLDTSKSNVRIRNIRAVDRTGRSYVEAMSSEDELRSRVVAIEDVSTTAVQGDLQAHLLSRVEQDIIDIGRWVSHGNRVIARSNRTLEIHLFV